MGRKKISTRDKLLNSNTQTQAKADKYEDVAMQLLVDPNVLGEHIALFNKVAEQYDEIVVESPIFIYQNLDLIKLRVTYFSLSMNDKFEEEKESITDNMKESVLNNNYIIYLQTVSDYYSNKNNSK